MPQFAIDAADPLGYGTLDGSSSVNITSVSGGPQQTQHEVLGGNGLYIEAAVKNLKPIESWDVEFELLDSASLDVEFGVAVNTSYLIQSFSATCAPDVRPTCSVSAMKPSSAGMIKGYGDVGTPPTLTVVGGFGIVEKWGSTSASAFVASQGSVSMQNAEAMGETTGDYLAASILAWGFKKEVTVEAYAAPTIPAGAHFTGKPIKKTRDGYETHSASFWAYLDAQ